MKERGKGLNGLRKGLRKREMGQKGDSKDKQSEEAKGGLTERGSEVGQRREKDESREQKKKKNQR